MALRRTIPCSQCSRKFSMPGHLARHMRTHGVKPVGKKTTGKSKRVGRAKGGRPTGMAARLHLKDLGLEQLAEVIQLARAEARLKLTQLETAFS